jgi:spore germination protein
MFKDNDKVSNREAVFFIISSIIEVGTLSMARTLSNEVGTDAWIAYSLGFIFVLPGILITIRLGQRFYKHTFAEYSRIIAGPVIGWIFSSLLVIYWLFVCARSLRGISSVVDETLLDKTPVLVIDFAYLLVAAYICWYGIEPICRASMLITIVIVPSIFIMYLSILNQFRLDNFLPVLANGPLPVLIAGLKFTGEVETLTFFTFLIPFINRPKKALRAILCGYPVVFIMGILAVSLPIGILGARLSETQLFPLLTVMESAEFPGIFIERLGTLFSCLWIIIAFTTVCGTIFAMSLILSQMFGLKSHRYFIFPLILTVYFISTIPENPAHVERVFGFLVPYGIVMLTVLPLLLYIIAIIRGLKDS